MAHKIAAVIDWILGFNGCLMIATATLQIVSRALGRPVAWTVELLTFLGIFVDYFPRVLKNLTEFAVNALCTVFGALLLYATWDYTGLVGMGNPEQYLPFPPETNLIPVYILSAAIIFNGLWNLWRIVTGKPESEGGNR